MSFSQRRRVPFLISSIINSQACNLRPFCCFQLSHRLPTVFLPLFCGRLKRFSVFFTLFCGQLKRFTVFFTLFWGRLKRFSVFFTLVCGRLNRFSVHVQYSSLFSVSYWKDSQYSSLWPMEPTCRFPVIVNSFFWLLNTFWVFFTPTIGRLKNFQYFKLFFFMGVRTKQFLSTLNSFFRTAEYILSIINVYLFWGVGGDWTVSHHSSLICLVTEQIISFLYFFLLRTERCSVFFTCTFEWKNRF